MNTVISPLPSDAASRQAEECAQPYIYSFRCSRGMDECLSRFMQERGLNRTSVIRLALYALDCFSRRHGVQELSLTGFVEQLQELAPEARVSFPDFIRGR